MFNDAKARRRRRGVPIHAYVGPNGSGKTLAMIHDTLPSLEAGRPVLSTVELLDYRAEVEAGEDVPTHPLCIPLTRWVQLMEVEHCDVLLDEVTGAVNARTHQTLPVQLQNLLVQLRKRDVVLRWTSPNWQRADVILREVTQAVTVCRGFLPIEQSDSLWPSRRWFLWSTFDASTWEDYSAAKIEKAKPIARGFHRRRKHEAQSAYRTMQGVETLDHITEAGLCAVCGGRRRVSSCRCKAGAHEDAGTLIEALR